MSNFPYSKIVGKISCLSKEKKYKYWNWIILCIAILLLIIIGYSSLSLSIWSDEVVSLRYMQYSVKEILEIVKGDVHPPLYYFILKFMLLLGHNILGLNEVFVAKMTSFVPIFLMLVYLGRKIAKNWGLLTGTFFCILIIGMPNILDYGIEIRTYSWSLFFVTAAFIYGYECLEDNSRSWIIFTIYSILAAYTHHYACISVGLIYIYLLLLMPKKQKYLKKWIFSVFVCCIIYLLWFAVTLSQFETVAVGGGFWISTITINDIYKYFKFLFQPRADGYNVGLILGSVLASFYLILYITDIFREEKQNDKIYTQYVHCGAWVLLGTISIGVIVSIILYPVFMAKYMICSMGCFWLCFAYIIARSRKKKKFLMIILITIGIIGIIDTLQLVRWEEIKKNYYNELSVDILDNISPEDTILVNHSHLLQCLEYYTSQEVYYINVNEDNVQVQRLNDNAFNPQVIAWYDDIINKSEGKIWVFQSENAEGGDIINYLKQPSFTCEYLGLYHLEYYNFEVYDLKIN